MKPELERVMGFIVKLRNPVRLKPPASTTHDVTATGSNVLQNEADRPKLSDEEKAEEINRILNRKVPR